MPFSIWEYLRERTRDAVLAGIQDALDIAEEGDAAGGQHQAAKRLWSRLARSLERSTNGDDPKLISGASMNGEAAGDAAAGQGRQGIPQAPPTAPESPAEPITFEDELERRIDAAAPQAGTETLPPGRITTRRKRGRPPKNNSPSEDL